MYNTIAALLIITVAKTEGEHVYVVCPTNSVVSVDNTAEG